MTLEEPTTTCQCGKQLADVTGWTHRAGAGRIQRECPKSGRNLDLSEIACDVLEGWTGKPTPLNGGLTFRFALLVDCHKYWPHEEEEGRRFSLRPEFLDLWHTYIGVPFEVVVTFD